MFDVNKSVQYLNSHAQPKSTSNCARYVRTAISSPAGGGQPMGRTLSAKNYGPQLEAAGFRQVTDGTLQKGDVAVIQPYPGGNQHGHMAMYNGQSWVSDFKQRDMYPGPGYRAARPSYKIYRHQSAKKGSTGTGAQGITRHGKRLKKGANHGVYLGPKQRHLSHRRAELEGGGNVTQGSSTTFVGSERYPVARLGDETTDAPIAVGEDTVLVG
ncbi:hypothetical protein E8A73_008470 [Polyangium aurulentum]|nr:hypothetical protein [Polyangium aurulentum]UQA60490.1 hypothetical protein E8A73_008470 [Polyangium aurulentum]